MLAGESEGNMTIDNTSTMREVNRWRHQSTNSAEYVVAELECGHERTFNGSEVVTKGMGGKLVRCWKCDELAKPL